VPDHPWLFTGWIDRHGQPEAVAPARDRIRALRDRRTIENRLGRGLDEVEALIDDQPRVAAILRSLPQTLCHHDAVAANVFAGETGGKVDTVLIDWEMVGPGPAGADLTSLLFSSARRGDLPTRLAIETLPDAREAYVGGMEDAGGVTTDADALATAVDAAIALRWVLVRDIIVALADGTPVRRGSAPNETPGEAMDQLIGLSQLLFAAAERTRTRSRRRGD
jgi:aminoglycoside phosphotransferase (APT) family kinase protein